MFPLEKIGANANITIIGVTGCVSSGKSTLLAALNEMNVPTLSVDTIIHNLYTTSAELIHKIIALLGEEILLNHKLNRTKIAKKVFTDKKALYKLEALTTPYVLEEIRKEASNITAPYLAIEVPLLFELSLENLFDKTIFVDTKEALCKKRSSLKDITLRNERFFPSSLKREKASITLTNNGSLAEFKQKIHHCMEGIIT